MEIRTALYLYLPLDASAEEVEAAHQAIDNQFGVNPAAVSANGVQMAAASNMGGAVVANAAATTTGVELDADGLPWDERIHSSNHKKDSKGGWWSKRGVDPTHRKKIEAELRAAMTSAAPAAPAAPVTPTAPTAPAAPNLPSLPGAGQPDPAYTALVQLIAQNTNSPANPGGRLTDAWVKELLTAFSVPDGSLQNLAHAPQLVKPIHDYIVKGLAS